MLSNLNCCEFICNEQKNKKCYEQLVKVYLDDPNKVIKKITENQKKMYEWKQKQQDIDGLDAIKWI